jgi:hypothetical protein
LLIKYWKENVEEKKKTKELKDQTAGWERYCSEIETHRKTWLRDNPFLVATRRLMTLVIAS